MTEGKKVKDIDFLVMRLKKLLCYVSGHREHYSAPKGSISHHKGHNDEYFCLRCNVTLD